MLDREGRIEELFDRARQMPPDQQQRMLIARCADDPAMREEINRLLAVSEGTHDLLDAPLIEQLEQHTDEDAEACCWIGRKIGQFTLQSHLGTGGMGMVFEALQDRPRRRVALKLMRPGLMSGRAIKRFMAEAEILANLQHPCIAQVFEAGIYGHDTAAERPASLPAGGVPYFVMEFVEQAAPITRFARQHQLTIEKELELFVNVCDAVHHGHQRGFIHRDLKPANILINSQRQAKVIDFGIARATDSDITVTTLQTNASHLFGTLQYMSPEQCGGDVTIVDVRSDVYSLGVVLYELCCDRLPYDLGTSSLAGAARIVQDSEPPPPRRCCRNLHRDVQTIILKALAKNPDERYQNVAELAEDIRRHLRGDVIAARPHSLWSRTCRQMARHPVLTTSAACLAIVLLTIASTAIAVWQLRMQPASMAVVPELNEVRMLSTTGEILDRWRGNSHRITGELIARPREHGGGKLAVIGYCTHTSSEHGRPLQVFRARQPPRDRLWTSGIATDQLPLSLRERGFTGEQFRVSNVRGFNIFPDRPGNEIVVIYQHEMYSQCAVRIYDQNGELLFHFWHDGNINDLYWMSGAELLICAGVNGEVYWEDRGERGLSRSHPIVIFAVSPLQQWICTDWLRTPSMPGAIHAAWYRCLAPPELSDFVKRLDLGPPLASVERGTHVSAGVYLFQERGEPIRQSIMLNALGEEAPESRVIGDDWYRAVDAPDPYQYHFCELPPIAESGRSLVRRK